MFLKLPSTSILCEILVPTNWEAKFMSKTIEVEVERKSKYIIDLKQKKMGDYDTHHVCFDQN